MDDNKLRRLNDLQEEIDKGEGEILSNNVLIRELTSKNEEISKSNDEKRQIYNKLSRARYSDKKLRKNLLKIAEKSDKPETALKIERYIKSDAKDIPEDILSAFVELDNIRAQKGLNKNPAIELIETTTAKISDFFLKDYSFEEEVTDNDN